MKRQRTNGYQATLIEIHNTCDWCGGDIIYGDRVFSDGDLGLFCSEECVVAFHDCDLMRELFEDF